MTADGIIRRATFSDCGTYRFQLERRWADGPACVWIMLNPSTADAFVDDPTIRRVIAFSRRWGHPAAIVANLYPFRSPSPDDLKRWLGAGLQTPGGMAAYERNSAEVGRLLVDAPRVVAAWGNSDASSAYDGRRAVQRFLSSCGTPMYCLGRTRDGAPIHPLARGRSRVPDDAAPTIWRRA